MVLEQKLDFQKVNFIRKDEGYYRHDWGFDVRKGVDRGRYG